MKACRNEGCVNPDAPEKGRHDACNWLDWMVDDAGGVCPHCGGNVTNIETVTPLGRLLDRIR